MMSNAVTSRRELLTAGATALAMSRLSFAKDLPTDTTITRVMSLDLKLKRSKFVGKNARRDDHGTESGDRIVRIFTDSGHEGFGNCGAGADECAMLLGRNPMSFFHADERKVTCPFGRGTTALWDLAGKILDKPVWKLLGGDGPQQVKVYDGSIYFAELVPQNGARGLDIFKDEIDQGLQRGHRAFKIKVGRGNQWMLREEGDARDLEVIRLIRRHAGDKVTLGVDANNGYDPARTRRLLDQVADCRLAFVEEMFPESVDHYRELKSFLRDRAYDVLIADGESAANLDSLLPFMEAGVIDILQGDVINFGFEELLREAAAAKPLGQRIAPHNWGTLLGFYMQLQVGRAIPNFYMAEQDPLSCDAVIAEGYTLREGSCSVPDAPGLGLRLDEKRLPGVARVRFDLKA